MVHHFHCMILHSTAYSEVHLTQQSPQDLPCSGEEMILQCTLPGIIVFWSFPGGEITLAPGSVESVVWNFRAHPVGVVSGNFTSTLSFPAENGTVISCINGLDRSMQTSKIVKVQGILTFLYFFITDLHNTDFFFCMYYTCQSQPTKNFVCSKFY